MSAEILKLDDYRFAEDTDDINKETRSTTRAFMKRVDMNLININAFGAEYIARISEGVYKTIWAGGDVCTNVDYILRVEHQVKSCNLHECMELLEKLDHYLQTPTISSSLEKPFIMHVRNKVLQRAEFLKQQRLRSVRSH